MNRLLRARCIVCVILILIIFSFIQALAADHVVIPVSNPLKPVTVNVALHSGSIGVTGYAGKEVIMDVQSQGESNRSRNQRTAIAAPQELKRISSPSTGMTVQEENNIVNIGSNSVSRSIFVALKVPVKTNLVLNTNGGGIISVTQVEGQIRIDNAALRGSSKKSLRTGNSARQSIDVNQTKGEIEINNAWGGVLLNQVSGSAVVYTTNGDIRASFLHVAPGKPISFSSMNGVIDVWLPPGIKANTSMQSSNGEIHSDFDVKIDSATVQPVMPETNYRQVRKAGHSRAVNRILVGKINGGGPEMQFKTYRGNIYIRKFLNAPQDVKKK